VYVNSSSVIGTPSKIVWTGNKFYCIGTTGISGTNNILQSPDGITWTPATNGNIPDAVVRDIAFSPYKITLSPTDQYKRYLLASSVNISGTLITNDWVQLKNITAFPQVITTVSGSVIIPAVQPYATPTLADTASSIVYSSGSSLRAV